MLREALLMFLVCALSSHKFSFSFQISSLTRTAQHAGTRLTALTGKTFLGDKNDDVYLTTILRRSIEGTMACLKDKKSLIEVEFPAKRKVGWSLFVIHIF